MEDSDLISVLEDESLGTKLRRLGSNLLKALFEVFYIIYKDYYSSTRFETQNNYFYTHIFGMLIYCFQVQSLAFPVTVSSWDSFSWVSDIFGACRVDYLVMRLGLSIGYLSLALGVTILPMLFWVLLYVKVYKHLEVNPPNYRYVVGLPMRILKNMSFLPLICIFLAAGKYSSSSTESAFQYPEMDISHIRVFALGPISNFCAGLLVVLVLLETIFQYEQFFTRAKSVVYARAHSKIETYKFLILTAWAVSHFYLHESNKVVHLVGMLLGGVFLALGYLVYLPFYNKFVNFTHSSCYLVISWTSLGQLLAMIFDNGALLFHLMVFVTPCLVYLHYELLNRRIKIILEEYSKQIEYLENIYYCELVIRYEIWKLLEQEDPEKKAETKEKITELFQIMSKKFRTNNFFGIWEFIYVFNVLKDQGLARLKLSQTARAEFDLEGTYHKYKFTKVLDDFPNQYIEEVDFFKFRRMHEETMRIDKETCDLQLQFWNELSLENPQTDKIERIGFELFSMIKKSKKASKDFMKAYPSNFLSLNLYASFLKDVYNDTMKGIELESRAENERKQQSMKLNKDQFSLFDLEIGTITTSGNLKDIGTILDINANAGSLLGIIPSFAKGMNISSFLPPPMSDSSLHNLAMSEFILKSKSTEVKIPFNNLIVDYNGFLVDVNLQIKCLALDSHPFFVTAIRKNTKNREIAIVDSNGVISKNTRKFPVLLGFSESETRLDGLLANTVINNYDKLVRDKKESKVQNYVIPGTVNNLSIMFCKGNFKNYLFRVIYLTGDIEERRNWRALTATVNSHYDDLLDLEPLTQNIDSSSSAGGLKGILKAERTKSNRGNIKFNIEPIIYEIGETDFKPGKHVGDNAKDVPSGNGSELSVPETPEEEELSVQEILESGAIVDLKDLQLESIGASGRISSSGSEGASNQGDEDEKKKSPASVASSAQSSNASFTSSPDAQILLTRVKDSMVRFKSSFFFTTLIVISANFAMMIYLTVISSHYTENVVIKELSDRRVVTSYLGLDARNIHLAALGVLEDSGFYKQRLKQNLQKYRETLDLIQTKLEDWTEGEHRDTYVDSEVVTWELQEQQLVSAKENLVDVMKKFLLAGQFLYETPLEEITYQNKDFFYLYRNAPSESLEAMNDSLNIFITSEEQNLSKILQIILVLAGCAIALMVMCFVVIILPTIMSVEKSNQTVWKIFYRLPLDLVQEMRSKCEDRLETLHGVEVIEEFSEKEMFKSIESRSKITCSKKWPYIIIRLSFYYILSAIFFGLFFNIGYKEFGNVLLYKPQVVNWAGQRILSTNLAYFWVQESKYLNASYGYYSTVPHYQIEITPGLALTKHLEELKYSEQLLLFGDVSRIGQNSQYENYLLENGCLSNECKFLSKGVHSAVNLFINECEHFQSLMSQGKEADIANLRLLKEELMELLLELKNNLNQDIEDLLSKDTQYVMIATIVYAALVIVMYFILYVPILNNVERQITNVWSIGRLIPIEHRKKILEALKGKKETTKK